MDMFDIYIELLYHFGYVCVDSTQYKNLIYIASSLLPDLPMNYYPPLPTLVTLVVTRDVFILLGLQ